jgi:hypothetical protein
LARLSKVEQNTLIMKVIYYYYFLFYSKILRDDEPHLLTTLVLSASEGFLVNGILDISLTRFVCLSLGMWPMIWMQLLFIFANYFYYHFRTDRAKEIVKTKPMFFSSHKLSIILTILFFITTFSTLFWGAVCAKHIFVVHCR